MSHRLSRLSLALGVLLSAGSALAADPPRYTLQLLADLPGGGISSQGMSVNASGRVGGQSIDAEGHVATVWTGTPLAPVSLGDLPGSYVSSMVYGINDAGTTVGTSSPASGLRAFRRDADGVMMDLGDLPGGSNASGAYAVNNLGVAVGYSYSTLSGSNPTAVIWAPGSQGVDLGDLPGGTYGSAAKAINNVGVVAGYGQTAGGRHAMRWTADTGMVDLGNIGNAAGTSEANGINDAGWIVGSGTVLVGGSSYSHATLWRDGEVIDLGGGAFHGHANDVNNLGQIVGTAHNRLTLWGSDLQEFDLRALVDNLPAGLVLSSAMSINDSGQITGWADTAGVRVGYLLTPVATVPEPGSAALLLAGLLAGGRVVRRRTTR